MPDPICCVCHNAREGTTLTLTPEERAAFPKAPETVHYCKACLRVMQDRESGAQLIKGIYEMKLRGIGVPNARGASEGFYRKLLQATVRKLH